MMRPLATTRVISSALLWAWAVSGAEVTSSEDTSHTPHADGSHSSHGGDDSHSSHGDDSHGYSPDPSVFVLGDYFDYDTFVVLLSIVGGCAIVMEMALSRYERWLKSEGDTFQSTLYEKIVQELMTLGVVSFALYLLQPVVPSGDLFLIFEFSHYVIFFIAIFTVVQLVLLGASTYPIKRRWDVAAYTTKEELVTGYRAMIEHTRKCSIPVYGLGRVSLDLFHWGSKWVWIDAVYYHIARSVFIRQHGSTANFDFARYACLVTDRQILNMANISLRSWLALVVLRWVVYGFRVALSSFSVTVTYKEWLAFGVILCLLELAVLFACMLGVRRVCIKLGADPKDPVKTMDAVLERIWVAPFTEVQHAASMHGVARRESSAALGLASTTAVHGGEGGGGLDGPTGAAFAESGSEAAEAERRGGIPEITMKDAFVYHGNLYLLAVELLMLFNSYYLAFYAMYFIAGASDSSTEWVWIILLPLPILCGVLMAYRRVVPLIALLSTIVMMQPTDVADVEQEAVALNKLRRKLVIRVEEVLEEEYKARAKKGEVCPEGETSAEFLIKRWDEDNNGNLSYKELEKGLEEIGLVLSSAQRRELLRLADPDRSGSVDINELTELLYDVRVEMAAAAAGCDEGEVAPERERRAGSRGGSGGVDDWGGGRLNAANSTANERVERLLMRRASEKMS